MSPRHTLVAGLAFVMACTPDASPANPLFESLAPEATGITFRNDLPERPEFNIINYLYYYNGGGVAVGDVDNDGLQDLYFSSNLDANRLYRNKGNYQFEDITERAGVAGPPGWKTGVTMADVNGDGLVDLYVSAVRYLSMQGRNVLYVNRGDGTFADSTDAFGLSYAGYSTQAAFLDYDGDGDLDLYLLVHSTHNERGISPVDRARRDAPGRDRFYRNDGNRFTDVTEAAGLVDGVAGFGLGVVVTDYNNDGCPDLYVANDFQENDFLYRNTCQGSFTELITTATQHTSRFSMGVDAADFNNDGLTDLFVADMLPEREDILKTSASSEGFNLFDLRLRAGYHPQYPRNTLQLNRGNGRFSEIGYQAGVFASDWSWAPLFADLDNDGRKDLFVTNGILRRPNDLDYINYISAQDVQASLARGITDSTLSVLNKLPSVPLPNHAFRNEGNYRFRDHAAEWGLATKGFSNGAAWVDLNNSGALDLVVNAVNAPAGVYRNLGKARTGHHSLTVQLRGAGRNTFGVGARVTLTVAGETQMLEQFPTRGFQSSVDPRLHFGTGVATRADSLVILWPDRRQQVLHNVALNTVLTLWQDSAAAIKRAVVPPVSPLFTEVASQRGAAVRHLEEPFLDYNREPLMPHLLSTQGPALAVADVNGDGTDDIFVGGGKWQAGQVLTQGRDGRFTRTLQPALAADSLAEDVDATFFDADGDGDQDLFVVSGGNEFWGESEALRDRLYLNDGKGSLVRATQPIPGTQNGGTVAPGDYDGDGDLDLFVGNRVVARAYGRTPPSQLLRNEGGGRFSDVTAEVAPGLLSAGMVASALWMDIDADRALDLVLAGEWTPLRVLRQVQGRFVDATSAAGLDSTEGWWNVVRAADLNGDGQLDLIAGNLGLNSYLRATPNEPAQLFVNDYYATGTLKQILTFYKNGVSYPLVGRDELVKLMPPLRGRYPNYKDFGAATLKDILPPQELAGSQVLNARTFAHVVALHRGGGRFEVQPLPAEAQFAPVYAIVPDDFDGDGRTDLLLAGNAFGVPPVIGRHDAGQGLLLRGSREGAWVPMDMTTSGLLIQAEARRAQVVRDALGGRLVAITSSGGVLQLWRVR